MDRLLSNAGTPARTIASLLAAVLLITLLPLAARAQATVPAELDLLCVENDDKVLQATQPSDCGRRQVVVDVPATRPVHLCGRDDFGLVRYTTDPAACTRDHEFPITIPDDGPVILCSKNVKNGRIQPTGELRFADNVARCDSKFYTAFITPAAPQAVADTYTVDEDSLLTVPARGVLDNDADASGGPLTARLLSGTGVGTVSLAGDGGFTWDPRGLFEDLDAGQSRDVTFTYATSDGELESPAAGVTITVTGRNDVPHARDDVLGTDEDTPLQVLPPGVLGNDADAEPGALTAALVEDVSAGTLELAADGGVVFDPGAAFQQLGAGESAPVRFRYVARDGHDDSAPATATIAVAGVDDPPVATADAFTTDENTPFTVTPADLLANDVDVDADALAAIDVISTSAALVVGDDGSATLDTAAVDHLEDGDVEVFTLTYRASADGATSETTTATLAVTGISPPAAAADRATTDEDTPVEIPVLANDRVASGALAIDVIAPTVGAATVDGEVVTFDPRGLHDDLAAGGAKTVTFTYRLTSDEGTSTAVVAVRIEGRNDVPVAVDDRITPISTTEALVLGAADGVLANDPDDLDTPDGDLHVVLVSPPDLGRLDLAPDGGLRFDPAGEMNEGASTTFRYRVSDGIAESATATVTLGTVEDAVPVILDQVSVLPVDADPTTYAFPVRASDHGGPITFDLPQGSDLFGIDPATGALTLRAGVPPVGDHPVRVRVTDAAGQQAEATVTVRVVIPFAPTADVFEAVGGVPLIAGAPAETIEIALTAADGLLANDGDPGRITTDRRQITTDLGGLVELREDGSFGYLPPRPRATTASPACLEAVPSRWDGTFETTFEGRPAALDGFTYTVREHGSGLQEDARVDLYLTDVAWFVDPDRDTAAATCGTALHPFRDLADLSGTPIAPDLDGPGEAIVVLGGATASGIELEAGQRLLGRGSDVVVAGDRLLLAADAAAPTIVGGEVVLPAAGTGPAAVVTGLSVDSPTGGIIAAPDGAAGRVDIGAARIDVPRIAAAGGPALALGAGAVAVTATEVVTAGAGDGIALSGTGGAVTIGTAVTAGPIRLRGGTAAVGIDGATIEGSDGLLVDGWAGAVTVGTADVTTAGTVLTADRLTATGVLRIAALRAVDPAAQGGTSVTPRTGVTSTGNRGTVTIDVVQLGEVDLGVADARGLAVRDNDGVVRVSGGTIAAAVPAAPSAAVLVEITGGSGSTRNDAASSLGVVDQPAIVSGARSLVVSRLDSGGRFEQRGLLLDRGAGISIADTAHDALVTMTGGTDVRSTPSVAPAALVDPSDGDGVGLLVDDATIAMTGQHSIAASGAPAVRMNVARVAGPGVRITRADSADAAYVADSRHLTGYGIDLDGVTIPATTTLEIQSGTVTGPARGGARIGSSPRVVLGAVAISDAQRLDADDPAAGALDDGAGVSVVGGSGVVLRGTTIDRSAGPGIVAVGQRDLTLERVTVRDADGAGVALPDPAGTTRILGSQVSGALGTGVDIDVVDVAGVADESTTVIIEDTAVSSAAAEVDVIDVTATGAESDLTFSIGGTSSSAALGGRTALDVRAADGADIDVRLSRTRLGNTDGDAVSLTADGGGSVVDVTAADLHPASSGGISLAGGSGLVARATGGGAVTGTLARVEVAAPGDAGVLLDGTRDVRLDQVDVRGPEGTGITVLGASGTTLDRVSVEGAPAGHGIELLGIRGATTVVDSRVDLRGLPDLEGPDTDSNGDVKPDDQQSKRQLDNVHETCTNSALAAEQPAGLFGPPLFPFSPPTFTERRPPLVVDGVSGIFARAVEGQLEITGTTVRGATSHQITVFNGSTLPGVTDPERAPAFDGSDVGQLTVGQLDLRDRRGVRAGLFAGAGGGGALATTLQGAAATSEAALVACAVDGGLHSVTTPPQPRVDDTTPPVPSPLVLTMHGFEPALVMKASGSVSSVAYDLSDVTIDYSALELPPAFQPLVQLIALMLIEEQDGLVSGSIDFATIVEPPGDGVLITSSGQLARGYRIVRPAGDGVVVRDVDEVELSDVTVEDPGGHGIAIERSADISVVGATVTSPGGAGLRATSSVDVDVVDLTVTDPGSHGVDLHDVGNAWLSDVGVEATTPAAAPRSGVRAVDAVPLTLIDVRVSGVDDTPVDVALGGPLPSDTTSFACPRDGGCDGDVALSGITVTGTAQDSSGANPAVDVRVGQGAATTVRLGAFELTNPNADPSAPPTMVAALPWTLDAPLDITISDVVADVVGDGAAITSTSTVHGMSVHGVDEVRLTDVALSGAGASGIRVVGARSTTVEGGGVASVGSNGYVLVGDGSPDATAALRGVTITDVARNGILFSDIAGVDVGRRQVGVDAAGDPLTTPTTVLRPGEAGVVAAGAADVVLRHVEVEQRTDTAIDQPGIDVSGVGIAWQCTVLEGNALTGTPSGGTPFRLAGVGLSGYQDADHPGEDVAQWLARNANTPVIDGVEYRGAFTDVVPC